MEKLQEVYGDRVVGSIKGLDRLRLRGTLRWLAHGDGMRTFLGSTGRLLKDFKSWAGELTRQVREGCAAQAEQLGIESIYLKRGGVDKDALARQIAERAGRANGSICMFSAVEPCWSPLVKGNRQEQRLELEMGERKCVHVYHYFDDPQVGFGHVRLQTWLPFTVQICLNGRHWLEKQLQGEGIAYVKDGNCFPYIADLEAAQRLLDEQLRTAWPALLDRLLTATCPVMGEVLAPLEPAYYWSADETKYATDLIFRDGAELARLYPRLIRHAITVSDTPTVMRFLGKRNVTASGQIKGRLPDEVCSDWRRRAEGVRIKHWVDRNSVKAYDKSGTILRIETTINNTRPYKVWRRPEDDPNRAPSWQKLRKGVADLHRRSEVSDQCNQRYEAMLASAEIDQTVKDAVADSCRRLVRDGRPYRGLNLWRDDDFRLLSFLAQGEWAIRGFRNRDLRDYLGGSKAPADPAAARRQSARATRLIRLLRAHGLIRKVSGEHRYLLTDQGRALTTAILTASEAKISKLELAAA
jgi:hypothetical protein